MNRLNTNQTKEEETLFKLNKIPIVGDSNWSSSSFPPPLAQCHNGWSARALVWPPRDPSHHHPQSHEMTQSADSLIGALNSWPSSTKGTYGVYEGNVRRALVLWSEIRVRGQGFRGAECLGGKGTTTGTIGKPRDQQPSAMLRRAVANGSSTTLSNRQCSIQGLSSNLNLT